MFDTVIRNGLVVDGTGASGRVADVGVTAGRITAIGEIAEQGIRKIDAAGRVLPAAGTIRAAGAAVAWLL